MVRVRRFRVRFASSPDIKALKVGFETWLCEPSRSGRTNERRIQESKEKEPSLSLILNRPTLAESWLRVKGQTPPSDLCEGAASALQWFWILQGSNTQLLHLSSRVMFEGAR